MNSWRDVVSPEMVKVMTVEMTELLIGGKDPVAGGDLPRFSPDMPIGSTARWSDKRAITRISEHAWSFAPLA